MNLTFLSGVEGIVYKDGVLYRIPTNGGEPIVFTPGITETDPVFTASPAAGITTSNLSNWNAAYSWGNHATAGYLTAVPTLAQVTTAGNTTTNAITVGNLIANGTFSFLNGVSGYWLKGVQGNSTVNGNEPFLALVNNNTIASATFGWLFYDSNVDGSFNLYRRSNSTTGNQVLTIFRSNGNVGINTTSPGEKLQVAGNVHISGVGSALYFDTDASPKSIVQYVNNLYELHIYNGRGITSRIIGGNSFVSLGSGTTQMLYVNTSSGNVLIGTTTDGGYKLDVNGTSRATSFVKTGGTSSQFLKADGSVDSNTYLTSTSNAATATTLQTARNINGTSFNGSADITTAVWGNARTLTIGNTGKSVNGSGNVSWTLAEIQAEYQVPNNTLRNNLGDPTVREAAMFHGQFNNKFRFISPTLQEESADGVTWTTSTRASAATLGDMMRGEGEGTSFAAIPTGTIGTYGGYRLTWDVVGITSYVFLNALYVFNSTNGNNVTIRIEAYHNTNGWVTITGPHTTNNWPGHAYIPHTSIPYSTNASQYSQVRVTFETTHNAFTNSFTIYSIEWVGGYPAGKRNAESYDRLKNVTFPAGINLLGDVLPTSDNTRILGSSSQRFNNIYSAQSVISTMYTATIRSNTLGGVRVASNNANQWAQWFDGTGNLLLQDGGTFTDAGYRLDVTGTGRFTGNLTANSFIKSGGTSSQFLKADGSVDSTTYVSTSGNITGYSARLLGEDNRTISPSEGLAGQLKFGFTSWNNNNSSPYADFLHLRSYTDASGGLDNLVMFRKDVIGMRIWQQTWGSATAYATFADVWTSNNFTQTNVNNWNTAFGWGNHASAGYLTSYTETDTLASVTGRGATTSTNLTVTGGIFTLNNATSNRINFGLNGVATPTFSSYSAGVKLVLYNSVQAADAGFTIGIASTNFFFTTGTTASGYTFYGGTTAAMTISGTGNVVATGTVTATSLIGSAVVVADVKSSGSNLDIRNNVNTLTATVFDSSGNWLIQTGGSHSDSGYKLDVNGTVRVQGDITCTSLINNGPVMSLSGVLTSVVGYTGMFTVPTNPPGQQTLVIQDGIIVNVM